jgi:hypothetical protein
VLAEASIFVLAFIFLDVMSIPLLLASLRCSLTLADVVLIFSSTHATSRQAGGRRIQASSLSQAQAFCAVHNYSKVHKQKNISWRFVMPKRMLVRASVY